MRRAFLESLIHRLTLRTCSELPSLVEVDLHLGWKGHFNDMVVTEFTGTLGLDFARH